MVFAKETKTISARIPEDVHADILDRCNREGCTVNHFLNCAIELAIKGHSEFDFGDAEEDNDNKIGKTSKTACSPNVYNAGSQDKAANNPRIIIQTD